MDTDRPPSLNVLHRKRGSLRKELAGSPSIVSQQQDPNTAMTIDDTSPRRSRKGRWGTWNSGSSEMMRSASSPPRVTNTGGFRSSARLGLLQRNLAFTQDTRAKSPLSTVLATAIDTSPKKSEPLNRSKSFTSYRSPQDETTAKSSFHKPRLPPSPGSPSPSSSPKSGFLDTYPMFRKSTATRRPSSLSLQVEPSTPPPQDVENPFRTTSSSNDSPSSDSTPTTESNGKSTLHRRRNSLGTALMLMQVDSMSEQGSDSDAGEQPRQSNRPGRSHWSSWQPRTLQSDTAIDDDDEDDYEDDTMMLDSGIPSAPFLPSERQRSKSDAFNSKQLLATPVRKVTTRRATLLPKSKTFDRIANQLSEESKPQEAEARSEAEIQKVLKAQDGMEAASLIDAEDDARMDVSTPSHSIKIPTTPSNPWSMFKDTLPSPTFYAASRLNPEVDMNIRQDKVLSSSPSGSSVLAPPLFGNTSTTSGPTSWPGLPGTTIMMPSAGAAGRVVKRKYSSASQSSETSASGADRFEPYHSYQFKRRAVSPSVGGSPILSGIAAHTATVTPIGSPTSGATRAPNRDSNGVLQRPGTLLNIQDTNDGLHKMNLN